MSELSAVKRRLRIGIITTNKGTYSETFIKNHINELPFDKKVLYGGLSLLRDWNTEQPLLYPLVMKLANKLSPRRASRLQTYRLARWIKKNKIQVVLAEFGPVGEQVIDACRQVNVPLVVHFHGDDAHAKKFIVPYNGYQRLTRHATAVIGVSKPMVKQLISLGFPKEKVHLIPYGIDTAFFAQGSPRSSPPDFVAVGRFVDKKAPHLTILAFSSVLQEVPNATLTLIGTGPLLTACKVLVDALQITEQVTFRGVCSPEQVQLQLQRSRAFLMHSVTPDTGGKEGTPLSILEASATGLPVVSTRHAGIPEAIVHGTSGFLVEERDIKRMAHYMTVLAKDASLAQQMGEAGQKHIAAHYNLSEQIAKLAAMIKRTAGGR